MSGSRIGIVIAFLLGSGVLVWTWTGKVAAEKGWSQAKSDAKQANLEIKDLQTSLEVSKVDLSKCKATLAATEADLKACNGTASDLRTRINVMREEINVIREDADRLKSVRKGLDEELRDMTHVKEQLEKTLGDMRDRRKEETARMKQAFTKIGAETKSTNLGAVLLILDRQGSILFDFDQSALTGESRELLGKISGVLLASVGFNIRIHGHTDQAGSEAYNQQLSERRALAVRNYFEQAGIPPERLAWQGHGERSPLPSVSDPALNRRVEIEITDSLVQYLKETQGL